jgi:sugar phosphate isomerase/epimerase
MRVLGGATVKLGVYTAVLHDRPLREALTVIRSLGLGGAEINAGGFLPTPHLPVDDLLTGRLESETYLEPFVETGVELTGLNVNGNPLHADPEVGPEDAEDLRRAIKVAALLGVRRVVTMSGLPAAHPGGQWPAWHVNPWDSGYLDSLEYQWDDVAVPFWREIDALARDHDVKVCIEMHPQNLVFNPPTLQRLVEKTSATHVGAEMDPSHLFWQGIDPVAAIDYLGDLVFHAAAKDTRINPACRVFGVLDDRFTRIPPNELPTGLGGRHVMTRWPHESSWDFVAVGRGHDVEFWSRFLAALGRVDTDMAVNIEHEDTELGQLEGLEVAASTLTAASIAATQPA